MIPGEYRIAEGDIEINSGRNTISLIVINQGDRPIQIGSHFHFYEVNRSLAFDRILAFGMRLNIPAGTAIRFEPGEEKPIELVTLGGTREVYGLNHLTSGKAIRFADDPEIQERLTCWKEGKIFNG